MDTLGRIIDERTFELLLVTGGALVMGLLTLIYLIFSTQFDQYTACMHAASTAAEQQACKTQLENSISNRIGALGGS